MEILTNQRWVTKLFFTAVLWFAMSSALLAQSVYQPYSFQFYQKFSDDLYSTQTRIHSSLKPFFADDSLLKHTYDSLLTRTNSKNPAYHKLFNEHLIDTKTSAYTFYADILPDFQIGRDFSNDKTLSLTSLGVQIGGILAQNSFFTEAFMIMKQDFLVMLTHTLIKQDIFPGRKKMVIPVKA